MNERLSLVLPDGTMERLQKMQERTCGSVSQICRSAILKEVNRWEMVWNNINENDIDKISELKEQIETELQGVVTVPELILILTYIKGVK